MIHLGRGLVAGALTLALGPAVLAQPGEPGQTGIEERRTAAATLVTGEIERFTGPVDRHCGLFVLAGDPQGPPAATRRQISTALRCVQAARRQGRASWAVWQVGGVDATVFAGFAVKPLSDLHLVDSGGNASDVAVRPCLRPRLGGDGVVTCRNAPVDAASLRQALDRFRDDVARAFGRDVATAVMHAAAASTSDAASQGPDAQVQRTVARGREALRASHGLDWPVCPIHRTHALELYEQHWFCDEDAVFVAPLGRLRRLRPARPLP